MRKNYHIIFQINNIFLSIRSQQHNQSSKDKKYHAYLIEIDEVS